MCGTASQLDVIELTNELRWFGVTNTTNLKCEPGIRLGAAGPAGTKWNFTCRGEAETLSGATTIVGEETLAVGAQPRRAWRVLVDGNFSGKTRGTVSVNQLIDQQTGLVLQQQRTSDLKQQRPVGDVSYHLELTTRLRSVVPEN